MGILEHFLVPLDGSVMAEAALPVALGLGQPLGATISLLHVLEDGAPRTIHGEPHLQDVDRAEQYLASIAKHWSSSGVPIDWHVHPNSARDVTKSIIDHSNELRADLVVLTTHGRGGLHEFIFGSIAQQVFRGGPTPTLIVRPPGTDATEIYHFRLIMVPLGGTHDSELVLQYAGYIARAIGASVMLLSVIPTLSTASGDLVVSATFSPTATSAVLDLAQAEAQTKLDRQADELRQLGVEVKTEVARGATAEQVAAFARDNRADLLLLSTHGRAGLDGTLSGSIAPQVLSELRIPTMLVRVGKVS